MSYSYIINHPNHDHRYICNICTESIEPHKIIGLKCNYKKHTFCFDCINDWYLETKFNIKSSYNNNYNVIRMCPICRKNGGYLPNLKDKYCKDIHYKDKEFKKTCGYKLKNKDDYCLSIGHSHYDHKCKKHFDVENKKLSKLNKLDIKIQ